MKDRSHPSKVSSECNKCAKKYKVSHGVAEMVAPALRQGRGREVVSTLEGVRLHVSGEQLVLRRLGLTPVVSLHVTYPTEHTCGAEPCSWTPDDLCQQLCTHLAPTQSLQYKRPGW